MTTPAAPTAIRFNETDRKRLEVLCLFWGTDNMAQVVRQAIEIEFDLIEGLRNSHSQIFAMELAGLEEELREQYQKRLRELREQHAALMSDDHPLVPAAR